MIWDTVIRIALSPVLITQALRIRRIAQRLPEAEGHRNGTLGAGRLMRVQIIGDSSAAGVGARTQDLGLAGRLAAALAEHYKVEWHLEARTGATTSSTLKTLQDTTPMEKDIVICVLGVNDVTRLIPAWLWRRQQCRLIERLKTLYNPQHIYLTQIPPFEALTLLPKLLRLTLARHAQRLSVARVGLVKSDPMVSLSTLVLDPAPDLIAADGFHPSEKLYAIWGKEMASQIIADWPKLISTQGVGLTCE